MSMKFIFVILSVVYFNCYAIFHHLNIPEFKNSVAYGHLGSFQVLLLWMKLLCIFLCKSYCGHMFSFLLGINLGEECWLMGRFMFGFSTYCWTVFSKWSKQFTFHHQWMQAGENLRPWQHVLLSVNLILAILVSKWFLASYFPFFWRVMIW